jgi:hypothetical protein
MLRCEGLIMDVIGNLASAIAGLPAILGIAREHVAALVVVVVALSRWMGAIIMAVAAVALVSSGARAQTPIAEITLQTTVPVEEALVVTAVRTGQKAQKGESEQPGSAIYSPFSAGATAQQERLAVTSQAESAPEPGWTMTLAASTASAVALVWLLLRI